jgi:DNA-binding transcriptional ArsR family regulator
MANITTALAILADPTRRTLVDALRKGPLSVGQLADCVTVSRSAVSQHLQVLKAAQLVEREISGTSRIYRLRPQALGELRDYVDGLWGDALASFGSQLKGKTQRPRRAR